MPVHTRKASEKYPGAEPLPGYHLIKLLGRGGFGEVWQCEVPGGLHKAVKFVLTGSEQYRQELAAFEQIRGIRHPYLLTLERVELIGDEMVTIMELADCQIQDRFRECQGEGKPGIPRAELLGYLYEAAEALDFLSQRHGLQHLDVKPENIFLISGHVKVGDYGLVRRKKPDRGAVEGSHGFTPRYSAPEVLNGQVDTRTDQYSLGLAYVELLTGCFPYSGQTAEQLMYQHLNSEPDLTLLSPEDEVGVRRALSKSPTDRFASCLAFIQALSANGEVSEPRGDRPHTGSVSESNGMSTLCNKPPPLVEPAQCEGQVAVVPETFERPRRIERPKEIGPGEKTPMPGNLAPLASVVSLDFLHGMPAHQIAPSPLSRSQFVLAVVEAAVASNVPVFANDSYPDDALACRFLSTLPAALVPYKVVVVAEAWSMSVDQRNPAKLVLRWDAPEVKPPRPEARGTPPRPRNGIEVIVYRPTHPSVDYTLIGATFGPHSHEIAQKALDELPTIMDQLRSLLQNVEERRKDERHAATNAVVVYPQYSDGVVGKPIGGTCRDVSVEGIRFITPVPVRTERMYLEIKDVSAVSGLAILVRTLRTHLDAGGQGFTTVGLFRLRS